MSKHCPEFLATVGKLLPLLRQYKTSAKMPIEHLHDHLAWYWNKGTMSYVIDRQGARAICLIKLFRYLRQFLNPYVHDPCGRFCMIELMVADDPLAMGQTCEELTARFGPQAVVLWDRGKRTEDGAPRMYRWHQFMKLARRVSYGTIEMKGTSNGLF
jgi:hypothetical protein